MSYQTEMQEKTMKPMGPDYEVDFGDQKALVRDFEVTDCQGRISHEIGMNYQALCDLLNYSSINNVRNLVRRAQDEFDEDLFNPNEIKVSRNDLPRKTYSQALYIVGAGLDLFLMKSRQALAKEFRKWLKTRSLDLRTKGVALANGRADDFSSQNLTADLSHLSPSLARLQSVMQTMNGLFVETVKAAEERHRNTQKTKELESKTYKLEDRLDALDQWRQSNDIKMGEKTFTTAAETFLIMCSSTQGKTPNPGAVRLHCINAKFDERGLIRDRLIHVEPKGPLSSQILTMDGVRAFVHEILPHIPYGRSRVEPNDYTRRKYNSRNGFNIIRIR